jgi:hypothetical protein
VTSRFEQGLAPELDESIADADTDSSTAREERAEINAIGDYLVDSGLYPGGPGVGEGGIPVIAPADAEAGTAIDTERDGETEMRVILLQENGTVFAAGLVGDDFPRMLITVDGSVLFGNGSFDPADPGGSANPNGVQPLNNGVQLVANQGDGNPAVQVRIDGDNAEIRLDAAKHGFFGNASVVRPEVPAAVTPQDIADALVALGLVTQAS